MYVDVSPTEYVDIRERVEFLNPFCTDECLKALNDGKLQCECGHIGHYKWKWERQSDTSVIISSVTGEIIFHPIYSSGTAALRGPEPFRKNEHHFWEMKMLSNLYGTDVMVGVGTSKIVLAEWKFRFFSLLGYDKQSWGFSYNGTIQHNSQTKKYGSQFGFGSLIGVHVDMCAGTIEFYLNRKPLGVAFKGLKSKELYPMISSTAAQSSMKMTGSSSVKPSLQLKCLQKISKNPQLFEQFKSVPGLARIYEKQYFWLLQKDTERKPNSEPITSGKSIWTKRKKTVLPFEWKGNKKYPLYPLKYAFNASPDVIRPLNNNEQEASDSSEDESTFAVPDSDDEASTSNKL